MNDIEEIKIFIKSQIFNATKAGQCRELVLKKINAEGKIGSEIQRWETEKHHFTPEGVILIYNEVVNASTSDAVTMGGVQRYSLQSYHGDNKSQSARKTFRVNGDDGREEDEDLSSEGANVKGILAQQMRHNELIMKTSLGVVGQMMQAVSRTNAQQAARLDEMERDRLQNLSVVEKLLSEQHTRDMELRKMELREKSIGEVVSSLKQALPMVTAKLLGPKPSEVKQGDSSGGASLALEGIVTVFASLTPEQKTAIFSTLNDEQRDLLQSVFQATSN